MHEDLLEEFHTFARTAAGVHALMQHMVLRLHDSMSRYNWVGFYEVDPADSNVLVVGPFAGSFTPHERIPLDVGLCGRAAVSGKPVIVDDVSKELQYLAGSPMVKSEIVVPIFANKKLAAELDIESYFTGTFNGTETAFIQACATVVSAFLERR
jgi:L-methionine (R)-S-oxide reductase